MKKSISTSKFWVLIFVILSSCSTKALFDSYSYKETISAKVDALALMDKAIESYQLHKNEVEKLRIEMEKVYQYEKNRTGNIETTKMWELILSEEKNLYGGFIKKWKEKDSVSVVFVTEAKGQVEKAFDIIIDLENKKIKKADANAFINNN